MPVHYTTNLAHTYRRGEGWSVRPHSNTWFIDGLYLTAALGAPPPVEEAKEYHRIMGAQR